MDDTIISGIVSLVSERDHLKRIVGNVAYGMYLAVKADVPDFVLPIPESIMDRDELIARCGRRINKIDRILGGL